MKQDEELEQLLGEIPSSTRAVEPEIAAASPGAGPEKPHYGHLYPIQVENHPQLTIRSGESPPGAAHIDGDISSAFWKLNLNGKPHSNPHPRDFHPGSFPVIKNPAARWMMNSQPPPAPPPGGDFQRGGFFPGHFRSHEELIRFHMFLQQQQQQQQEQARVLAGDQNLGMNIPPRKVPSYSSYYSNYYSTGREEHPPGVCRYKFPQTAYVDSFNFPPSIIANHTPSHYHKVRGSSLFKGLGDGGEDFLGFNPRLNGERYVSVEEIRGRIFELAKDQHGCRFLQKKFDEEEACGVIFEEIIDRIAELMTDPFGNYLVQKVLEVCDDSQLDRVVRVVTCKAQLVHISLNMHGTRAVQKLIETLRTPEQKSMVVASLRPGVVVLVRDTNGNHVIQRCLLRLSRENNQFIFDAAASHCVEIAGHRHGCVVLQRCVDSAAGSQRDRLVAEITANSLVLAQDAYGNYVVQYILDLGYSWATREMIIRLSGKFAQLAMQKFSSNVVEKCLKQADEEQLELIIRELVSSASFDQLLHHEYGNYVIQCALTSSKGPLHVLMVEAIRPHMPALRSSPYGKRILSRTGVSKSKLST